MGKLCTTAKKQAIVFAKNNSRMMPQEYITTPEGSLLKTCKKATNTESGTIERLCQKLEQTTNPAHSVIQYEYLKTNLKEEQYTSIIKCTKHGLIRLMERFTPEEVEAIVRTPDIIKTQGDQAQSLIKKLGEKYGIITVNKEGGVITGINNLDYRAIVKLSKNYGWK